ncbi:hypothetical protein MMYC01_201884 [Madurella mycetomatis]|uniref:Uncharacterized protein n=1 Tax=Madurella mycetomatis TaxID=100816 RepID=A0A175WAQ1_9PEZI|nr:hypothetical protein MMYC01_201884 [Madurella mycetomatis]
MPPSNDDPYVRLHVTPLDAELLNVVISSALLPKARNISYHTIETFPEKRYGFLELPDEDAEKLRKKLNGAVLKGVKIRIERARPSRIPDPLAEAAMAKEKTSKKSADSASSGKNNDRKRKRRAEELGGVVLEEGRSIKRGWTAADEPKEKRSKKGKDKKDRIGKGEKKKQARSKYTSHAECLVKTVLPANISASADVSSPSPTKKKTGKSREVIVHEFERTTKFPTFLKTAASTSPSRAQLHFVDGEGWVDEGGNVIEAVKTMRPSPGRSENQHQGIAQEESDSGVTSDDASDGTSEPESPSAASNDRLAARAAKLEPTSSPSVPKSESARPKSSGSIRSLAIKIPPTTPNEPKVVHPLEALYKRPKQPDGGAAETTPETRGFSFFANGDEDSAGENVDAELDGDSGTQLPMTPFTRQDFELRGIRSAAPTPDTAHPNRRFKPWEDDEEAEQQDDEYPASGDSEDEEPNLSSTAATQAAEDNDKPASDFQKWFWENRGDLNRSWRKRRKLAGKEKRYRENRARMARAI